MRRSPARGHLLSLTAAWQALTASALAAGLHHSHKPSEPPQALMAYRNHELCSSSSSDAHLVASIMWSSLESGVGLQIDPSKNSMAVSVNWGVLYWDRCEGL